MAAEPRRSKPLFFLCSIAAWCSAVCAPDRPIEPLLVQVFVRIEGYHQRNVGPVKMPCRRRRQNHNFRVSAFSLQADMPHSSALRNKRVVNTHPCRTPPWMGKGSPLLCSPCTSPNWLEYFNCKINRWWPETPWSRNANHNAFQFALSKTFDNSRLTIHTGIPLSQALFKNNVALSKCSSIRRCFRKPCCSSGWCASSNAVALGK